MKEERTACINQIRGVLTEFGLVFGKSPKVLRAVLADIIEDASNELRTTARLVVQLRSSTGANSTSTCAGATASRSACARQPGGEASGQVIGIGELGAPALTAGVG